MLHVFKRLMRLVAIWLLIILTSCGANEQEPQTDKPRIIVLDSKYPNFENLISIAQCTGPDGAYTTEVHSTKEGYTFFKQVYGYKDENFAAVIFSDNEGYTLDDQGERTDTLSREVIEMIRGHEFHKLHMHPHQFYKNLQFEADWTYQENKCERYTGNDLLKNPMYLYYNPNDKHISGVEIRNPFDTTEVIEIQYKTWQPSELGKLAKSLEIIQGGKDTFTFDYDQILINVDSLKKRKR